MGACEFIIIIFLCVGFIKKEGNNNYAVIVLFFLADIIILWYLRIVIKDEEYLKFIQRIEDSYLGGEN